MWTVSLFLSLCALCPLPALTLPAGEVTDTQIPILRPNSSLNPSQDVLDEDLDAVLGKPFSRVHQSLFREDHN